MILQLVSEKFVMVNMMLVNIFIWSMYFALIVLDFT